MALPTPRRCRLHCLAAAGRLNCESETTVQPDYHIPQGKVISVPRTKGRATWIIASFIGAAAALIAVPATSHADEPKTGDAYASVWESLSDLLRRREYGTAAALLDAVADEPDLREHGAQIEADKAVVAGLQALEQVVLEQVSKLPEGSPLDIYGTEYTFVKYDKTPKGDELILQSKTSGRSFRKPVSGLPPSTWMQLAESKLDDLKDPALVLGVFAGFDQSRDIKAARKLLNDAAAKGADVSLWLARLEDAASGKKLANDGSKPKGEDDPIAGKWRVTLVKSRITFNMELRGNGTTVTTIPIETLVDMRRRKMILPKSNPVKGTWVKNEDGTYQVTLLGGKTAQFAIHSDRMIGKNASGEPMIGLRQAAKP